MPLQRFTLWLFFLPTNLKRRMNCIYPVHTHTLHFILRFVNKGISNSGTVLAQHIFDKIITFRKDFILFFLNKIIHISFLL